MQPKTSKPTSAQGFDQAWKKFHAENYGLDEVPLGWISAYRYADINGVTVSSASCFLRRAVQDKAAEGRNFRIKSSHGIRSVTYFKLKKP